MYDPELESRRKDWCQAKRCKEPSDIIVQGKGYCDYCYEELFRLNDYTNDEPCDCSDCMASVASFQEHKSGATSEQRSILTPADLNKSKKVEKKETLWASIEAYKEATGKRFRMTKDQKSRGLSRETAFKEFIS
jgi:hypothetical protein